MRKALVTGATGFAGSYLIQELLNLNDLEITGTYLNQDSLKNVNTSNNNLKLLNLDFNNFSETEKLIRDTSPDLIFHLAAQASAKVSLDNPSETITNNISGELNILESLRKNGLNNTKILIISSAEIYGQVKKEDLPIDEETPLNPTNPYAVSKIAQDFLGLEYFLAYKMSVVRVRPFNHAGPRQSPNFVISSFCKKIAEIEKGKLNKLTVGNLEARREFTDVRDMVKAYILAIEKGIPGEVYNLGNGRSVAISEIIEILIKLSKTKIEVEKDPYLLRPSDNQDLVCDVRKFEELTGWRPEIPLEETLRDTLDYWRNIT